MRRTTSTATSSDAGTVRAPAMTTLRRVIPYLWPAGQGWVKRRVIIALLFLLAAKRNRSETTTRRFTQPCPCGQR